MVVSLVAFVVVSLLAFLVTLLLVDGVFWPGVIGVFPGVRLQPDQGPAALLEAAEEGEGGLRVEGVKTRGATRGASAIVRTYPGC